MRRIRVTQNGNPAASVVRGQILDGATVLAGFGCSFPEFVRIHHVLRGICFAIKTAGEVEE
ncbi:MAG: hypothetical protein R3B91_20715 [Planctomycetaceae bacterium]